MYLLTTFKRKLGSKDKKKRKSRLLGKVALGSLGVLASGAYLKKRGTKDLDNIINTLTKTKNKITKNSSGDEGLDLAFKFKQEILKRKNKQSIKTKVKNYNRKRLVNDPFVVGSAISAGGLLALPFASRLARTKIVNKKTKKKN